MWEVIAPNEHGSGRWTFDSETLAAAFLLRRQGQSIEYATRHGGWTMRECTYSGYRNEATYEFVATTENDRETYEFLYAYASEMLRCVPSMTAETLGRNILDTCGHIVAQDRDGETPRVYGWADFLAVPEAAVKVLSQLADSLFESGYEVRVFCNVSESDVGESWRETVAGA